MAKCLNPGAWDGHKSDNKDAKLFCKHAGCRYFIEGAIIGRNTQGVGSSYTVIKYIGEGSFGDVYVVQESFPLSRRLALKIVRRDKFGDISLQQFFDEAKFLATLHHPNIVELYDFGRISENELPYLIMELANHSLLKQFEKNRPSVKESVPYIEQAAQAIYAIHSAGIIHRDIKPANFLIGHRGQVLLSDFGIGISLQKATDSQAIDYYSHKTVFDSAGTRHYMPYEQLKENKPRRESDQYALAATFYHLLAGTPPYNYSTRDEVEQAIKAQQRIPSPRNINSRIPPEVAGVLLRALQPDYRLRYRDVLEFARNYKDAVDTSLKRYLCQQCGYQNFEETPQCGGCFTANDHRLCPHCNAPQRFGARICNKCGRLLFTATLQSPDPFAGLGVQDGLYTIRRTLQSTNTTKIFLAIKKDKEHFGQKVVLKRWECHTTRYHEELIHYIAQTEPLMRLEHPLVPRILDRFTEETFYYIAMTFIDGEPLEERLQKLLKPLPEKDVVTYMNNILNVLISLEQQHLPITYFDITPTNIIIESQRNRASLVGFQIFPPEISDQHMTQPLVISPYLPTGDKVQHYDQRTCIYSLAACMHYALTNFPPPHFPGYPPIRELNPSVSAALQDVLERALKENRNERYQSFIEMKADLKPLLPHAYH
ncbi:MAG TPA: protein kinase [Ktedonobacteraceae bacterium]|nr:protein kinase [Ktedonobacteraceae bacterium]